MVSEFFLKLLKKKKKDHKLLPSHGKDTWKQGPPSLWNSLSLCGVLSCPHSLSPDCHTFPFTLSRGLSGSFSPAAPAVSLPVLELLHALSVPLFCRVEQTLRSSLHPAQGPELCLVSAECPPCPEAEAAPVTSSLPGSSPLALVPALLAHSPVLTLTL